MGYPAYVPGRDEIGKLHRNFVPYIFSHEEIRAFFEVADTMTCPPKSGAPRRRLIMPVLFRMLYCCGLRVSEATNLKIIVSQISCQPGQQSGGIRTLHCPLLQGMNAKCVSEIVQSGAVSLSAVGNPCFPQQFTENVVDRPCIVMSAIWSCKEPVCTRRANEPRFCINSAYGC